MSFQYLAAPFVGWLVADLSKMFVRGLTQRTWKFEALSYGGCPSSHTTVCVTTATLIGWQEGWNSPLYSLALAVTILFVIDAVKLRRWVGEQAAALNSLRDRHPDWPQFRERVGHTPVDIAAGVALGSICGTLLHWSV